MAARVAAAVIVIAGATGLTVAVSRGVHQVRLFAGSVERARSERLYTWDACIERQIRREVPSGAKVFIPKQEEYWRQSLPGLALPWARPVASRSHAHYVLSVEATGDAHAPGHWCGVADSTRPFPLNGQVRLKVSKQ